MFSSRGPREPRSDRSARAAASLVAGTTCEARRQEPSSTGREGALRAPTLEPSRRRVGVDAARAAERRHVLQPGLLQPRDPLRRVAPRVEQHVGDGVPHLPRALQHAVVIAIGEHLPRAAPARGSPRTRTATRSTSSRSRARARPSPPRSGARDRPGSSSGRAASPCARTPGETPPRSPARRRRRAATAVRACTLSVTWQGSVDAKSLRFSCGMRGCLPFGRPGFSCRRSSLSGRTAAGSAHVQTGREGAERRRAGSQRTGKGPHGARARGSQPRTLVIQSPPRTAFARSAGERTRGGLRTGSR